MNAKTIGLTVLAIVVMNLVYWLLRHFKAKTWFILLVFFFLGGLLGYSLLWANGNADNVALVSVTVIALALLGAQSAWISIYVWKR